LTQWVADKLQYSVKVQTADSKGKVSGVIEYKNFKQGPQADSLFEVPAGYTKFSMPFKVPVPGT
jgi:hypothetical protein